MVKFLLVFIFALLSGCAAQQHENNQLANLLNTQSPQYILQELQKQTPATRDQAQYQLNTGYLQFIIGDFANAITSLTSAKQLMEKLSATSISENVAAGTINETLRKYSGYPVDRVMVHNILALSYLFADKVYEARVEMLQSQVAMKKLADGEQLHGQLASAHLLAAIIYELLDEFSNALISYQDTTDIMVERGLAIPFGLKQALLRVSLKLGAEQKYRAYQQQFPGIAVNISAEKQLFVLNFDGVVSHKIQNSIVIPSLNGEQVIRISMPAYPVINKRVNYAQVFTGGQQVQTELVEDVEQLAREDLDKEYPSILLLTSTRAVSKYQLVKQVQEQDPLLGALANFITVVSEDADLRSWNMLPANIQFAYLQPQNNYVEIAHGRTMSPQIPLTKRKNVMLISTLTNAVFHYQQ